MSDLADTHFEPHFTGPGYDPGVLSGRFSEGELEKAIEARDASAALTALPNRDDPDGPGVLARAASGIRGLLGAEDPAALAADVKIHVAATGRIVRILTRREMYTDDESWRAAAAEVSPVSRVGRGFPPTALLHGIADRTVPVDQTVRLAKTLADADVPVKEVYVPGADHCFDFEITVGGNIGKNADCRDPGRLVGTT
jgi:acetyl esterase/lipase